MRTITVEKTLYKFEELSDKAKDRVKQWLDGFEFGAECTLEDFAEVAAILGFYDITPRYSGFWSQGDGASFTGRYAYAKGATKAIREYAGRDKTLWDIADKLQAIQSKNFYKLTARLSVNSHHYAHENTIGFEVSNGDNEANEAAYSEVKEQSKRLMRWLYKQLEASYDYYQTDEYAQETCEANGYEFDAKGVLQ